MAIDLSEVQDQMIKAVEMKHLTEEEAARSELIMQAAEADKQTLLQEVQKLTGIVRYFKKKQLTQ